MTWLVLGQDHDVEAEWVAEGLRARGDRPVHRILASTLVHDCRWEHRVSRSVTSSRLVLGDGTVIDSHEVGGVVNRLCWLGAEGFGGASRRDGEYAGAELFALGLSWLEGFGPRVLNRPTGMGLSGTWRTDGQWLALARSVGLPTVAYGRSSQVDDGPPRSAEAGDRAVLVVDGQVIGEEGGPAFEPAPAVWSGLVELQRASGLDVVEVHLAGSDGVGKGGGIVRGDEVVGIERVDGERAVAPGARVAVRSVSFLAALRRYGDPALDALHRALMARAGADVPRVPLAAGVAS